MLTKLFLSAEAYEALRRQAHDLYYWRAGVRSRGLSAYMRAWVAAAETVRDTRPLEFRGTDVWHSLEPAEWCGRIFRLEPSHWAVLYTVAEALKIPTTAHQKRLILYNWWGGERVPADRREGAPGMGRISAVVEAVGLGWLTADVPAAPHDLYRQPSQVEARANRRKAQSAISW